MPNEYTERHNLVLTKLAKRQLRSDTIKSNLEGLLSSVNNRSLTVAGWAIEADYEPGMTAYRWWENQDKWTVGDRNGQLPWKQYEKGTLNSELTYEMYIKVTYTRKDGKAPDKNMLNGICRKIYTSANQHPLGRWLLTKVDDDEYEEPNGDVVIEDSVGYTEVKMPTNFEEHFNHLYGLDSHVAMVKRAVLAGLNSGWEKRNHCALIGPPGCGKSDIARSLQRALGEEAVMEFDATATTAAGAIQELAEREILPRVLFIEEIEKAEEKNLSFLLAALDLRAEIRKTTARKNIQRDTKLFAVATVNSLPLFRKIASGALASRFMHKIFFHRPTREQLQMILQREVASIGGDFAWIDPCLDYCDNHKDMYGKPDRITDPREASALCLSGADMWITGEYQEMLIATSEYDPNWDGPTEDPDSVIEYVDIEPEEEEMTFTIGEQR
jgi:energy-coupling factor transporter ATP-binding protein EcfA2